MASGTINLKTNNDKLQGKIEWSSTANDSSKNSSSVKATIYIKRPDGYTTTGTFTGKLEVAGTSEKFSTHIDLGTSWVAIKSITKTVKHEDDGNGKCYISGECDGPSETSLAGATTSGSQTVTLDKIPRYASISHSLNSVGLNYIKINWSSDSTCDLLQYSLNGGNWITVSGSPYTINNLTPNTTYKIKTQVRRKDSQLYSKTEELSATTKDIAKISSANNFNHGDNTTVEITNPSEVKIKLRLLVGGTTIFNRDVVKGNNSINFNDSELDSIYKKYGSNNNVAASFIVDTYNDSNVGWTNSKDITIYLKGNQKTIKRNINGAWKRGKIWININGTWRKAIVWKNISGIWKRGV